MGLWTVLNHIGVLFPVTFVKDQFHAVGVLEEVSVKVNINGEVPMVTLGVKLATGFIVAAETLMNAWFERSNPALLDAFNRME